MTLYALVGFARPKPERAAELRELLLSLVAPTRAEDGALEYHFHEDKNDPDTFVFYEVCRSKAELDRHLALPHVPPVSPIDRVPDQSPDHVAQCRARRATGIGQNGYGPRDLGEMIATVPAVARTLERSHAAELVRYAN
ncbi:putative quinol monooxygenase [Nocardia sp. CA-119907]|uniref:putative quinol monooxygenase n=1 Tax=Nocardia sp. CA-119907 TaxID=3239973 RepID=UPI003D987458